MSSVGNVNISKQLPYFDDTTDKAWALNERLRVAVFSK